jgi:hypothetical protein
VCWLVGDDSVLTHGPQASEGEGGGVVVVRASWAERWHGLGRLQSKGRKKAAQFTCLTICKIKE